MKTPLLFLFLITLTSCTNYTRPTESAEDVRLFFSQEIIESAIIENLESQCALRGVTIGSEGHWHNYLFMSNRDLTQGALNDLKNNAREKDANIVIAHQVSGFITSVTYIGQSYLCNSKDKNNLMKKHLRSQ